MVLNDDFLSPNHLPKALIRVSPDPGDVNDRRLVSTGDKGFGWVPCTKPRTGAKRTTQAGAKLKHAQCRPISLVLT
jgi:hypothetical protein